MENIFEVFCTSLFSQETTDELENVYVLPTELGGLGFWDPIVEVLNQHSSSIQMYIPFDIALANDREQSQIKIAGN
ncbi:hypothetical protein GJ496_002358 [Pomphorhynchus laevis]|nr:hypothetical protein GJ496_002358 [Pomphorhynchus laevis]